MPTLPLFTPNPIPDASHRVVAPGGYEAWHFDAETSSGDLRFVAEWGEGCPCDVDYMRRYARYRRRPTRRPPPVPAEYPFASFAVYEGGRLLGRFAAVCPPGAFSSSNVRPEVSAGESGFDRNDDGTLFLRVRGSTSDPSGSRAPAGQSSLSADLSFRPILPQGRFETALRSGNRTSVEHRWIIADPLCEVDGTIRIHSRGAGGGTTREINFRGRGYHDHFYGTEPLGNDLTSVLRGRAILGERVYAFRVPHSRDGSGSDASLFVCDASGVEQIAEPTKAPREGKPPSRRYPTELAFGTRLHLGEPRVIDAGSSISRLVFRATSPGGTDPGTALCELFVPRGPGWGEAARRVGRMVATARR